LSMQEQLRESGKALVLPTTTSPTDEVPHLIFLGRPSVPEHQSSAAENERRLPEGVTVALSERSKPVLEDTSWQEAEDRDVERIIYLQATKDGETVGKLMAILRIHKVMENNRHVEQERDVYLSSIRVQGTDEPVDIVLDANERAVVGMRQQGIGSELLRELEQAARGFGASKIEGIVNKKEKERTPGLLEFYNKRDYRTSLTDPKREKYKIVKWLGDE
jgi:GNAT superfamily N-acetyltransferase